MITKDDLQAAIAECLGKRNPDSGTCIKLAAFYTIMGNMFPDTTEKLGTVTQERYSYAPAPEAETIKIQSKSEFAEIVNGKDPKKVWPIIDELMDTLHIVQPRLYNAVMEKLY